MFIFRRNISLIALYFCVFLLIPVSSFAGTKVPAGDMIRAAEAKMAEIDPQAWMVKAKYSKGDRSCRFEYGRFTFASPLLEEQGNRKSCVRIYIEADSVDKIRQLPYYRDEDMPDPNPQKAYEALMNSSFEQWWAQNETAWLYMELRPESGKYGKHCSGSGRYIWKVTGSGPGVDEDFKVYMDPFSMTVCGEEKKQHSMDSEEIQKSLQEVQKILKK